MTIRASDARSRAALGGDKSSRTSFMSANDDKPGIGVLLDLAPPFAFLGPGEYSTFRALVRAVGVFEIPLTPEWREAFFFTASERVRSCFVAPKEAMARAAGRLDPYMSNGFLEDRVPPIFDTEEVRRALQEACGLLLS